MGEKRYSVYQNLKYVFNKQWKYNKISVMVQILRIVSGVMMAFSSVWVTKTVLDSLEKNIRIECFMFKFLPTILVFALFTCLNYISNISMKRFADCMRYDCYVKEINDIAIRQDYSTYISPDGKNIRQKAEIAVGDSGQSGMNSFLTNVTEFAKNVFGLISYSTILALLNPWIIVLLLVSYALDSLISRRIQKWIHRNKDKQAMQKRRVNYVAYRTRTLSAAKDIRMYNMSHWLDYHGKTVLDDADEMYHEIENKRFKRSFVEQILIFLRNGLSYAYLIYLVINCNMTIGDFAAYLALIAGFSEWLSGIVEVVSALMESNNYVIDFRVYVDSVESSNTEKKLDISSFCYPYTITFENVCYSYPESDKLILDNISFEIKSGQKYALVGNNGAGKTTLIKVMSGLLSPTSGRVLLNGMDVRNIKKEEYYKLFSAIFQEIGLLPASIAKNIALCTEENVNEPLVWQCLRTAGLEQRVKSLPSGINANLLKNIADDAVDLSKGELQKLLLARAIYKKSEILILDEPTAALDSIAESEIYQKYNEIVGNRMSIFISHRLASTKFCDSIIFLKGNKIVEFGSHEELMKMNGEYARIFDIQSHYYSSNANEEELMECQY